LKSSPARNGERRNGGVEGASSALCPHAGLPKSRLDCLLLAAGATWFLGVSEWTFGTLLLLGFWNRKLGILGALGSSATFIATVTIIPFMPDGWDAAAGGFPAMTGNVPFLMKDVVLLATSLYLLTQDLRRELLSTGTGE
jgi:Protein of unknown function, DUF417